MTDARRNKGGRPKGYPKSGGRPPGGKNIKTLEREAEFRRAQISVLSELTPSDIAKILPKDVMLIVMRQALIANNEKLALHAAEKAAPYFHARLSSVEMNATVRRSLSDFTDDELAAIAGESGSDECEDGAEPAAGRTH
jgi:hypothetical protein